MQNAISVIGLVLAAFALGGTVQSLRMHHYDMYTGDAYAKVGLEWAILMFVGISIWLVSILL